MSGPRLRRRAVIVLTIAFVVLLAAYRSTAGSTGLVATYYSGIEWHGDGTERTYIDDRPSTDALVRRQPDFSSRPFSVEWRGFIAVPRAGRYTFKLVSDDGAWLFIRGKEVVSNGGLHEARAAVGTVALDAGVHSIFIRYFQNHGTLAFDLAWSRDGVAFSPVPRWTLLPDRDSYAQALAHRAVGYTFAAVSAVWVLLVVGAIAIALARAARPLAPIALLSMALNVWGIWWAMPNIRGWAPDEVVPPDVIEAVRSDFSHGWYQKYPPFHYFVLGTADAPILALTSLELLDVDAPATRVILMTIGRVVSLLFAVATLIAVYRCGVLLYGPRGARLAALTTAVTVPFAYYSKLANLDIPYLFWFTVSLWAFIRVLQRHERRDYVVFAVTAALAGCTKDQAWGLYALTGGALLVDAVRHRVAWQSIAAAIAAGAVTFVIADNVIANFDGFVSHVKLLLATPAPFREFPRTAAGELAMAARSLVEMRYMFGWPLAIVAAVAVVRGLAARTTRPSLAWLLVPPLSYYAAFVGVILFFFDRYLLPLTIVVSLFIGFWLEEFLGDGVPMRRARQILVATAFGYSVLLAAGIDYAMTVDSRYAVTHWLQRHGSSTTTVASLGPLEYALLADGFRSQPVESMNDVNVKEPDYVVLNADQMPTLPPLVQEMHEQLMRGANGYRLVLRYRGPLLPLPWQHPDLGDRPRHGPEFSDLSMINPTLEVFASCRSSRAPCTRDRRVE